MNKNLRSLLLITLTCFFIASCASGTALVTGTQRPATVPDAVIIYNEPPEKYEVIGLVSASSDSGWTAQGSLEYALEELKKQAAKIGANGILLENITQSISGGTYYYGVFSASTSQNISGKAIYIEEK